MTVMGQWVLVSSKATTAPCLTVFELDTNSALSQLLGCAKKTAFGGIQSGPQVMLLLECGRAYENQGHRDFRMNDTRIAHF
jgi:hypothetical protein